MISGSLLLRKIISNAEDVKRFYKHNLLRLVITAEIWYAIMYWFKVLWDPANQMLETMSTGELIWGMVKNGLFIDQVTLGSMWYIPMIICLYMMIPFVVMICNQRIGSITMLAAFFVFASKMLVPSYNSVMSLLENGQTVTFAINGANLFSFYLLYVLAGYWISKEGMKRLPGWTVFVGSMLFFAGLVLFQLWAFSRPKDFVIDYDFVLLLPCAMFVFELIRRCADSLLRLRRPIEYLSRISFAIYFVHVIILWALYWYVDCSSMSHTAYFLFLEAVPVLGSIVFIAVLSRIPACKKYLFMIH